MLHCVQHDNTGIPLCQAERLFLSLFLKIVPQDETPSTPQIKQHIRFPIKCLLQNKLNNKAFAAVYLLMFNK